MGRKKKQEQISDGKTWDIGKFYLNVIVEYNAFIHLQVTFSGKTYCYLRKGLG